METNQVLEKVGNILNLTDAELKEFINTAQVNNILSGVYEVIHGDEVYLVSEDDEQLEEYAVSVLLDADEFLLNANFILDYAEIEEVALGEEVDASVECIRDNLLYDLKKGRYLAVVTEMGAKDVYNEFQEGKISEEELEEKLDNAIDEYLENEAQRIENEIREDAVNYIIHNVGLSIDKIAENLWNSGYCSVLRLSVSNKEIAEDAVRLDGPELILNLTYVGSDDDVMVYKRD